MRFLCSETPREAAGKGTRQMTRDGAGMDLKVAWHEEYIR